MQRKKSKNVDKISYFEAKLFEFQGKMEAISKATTKENKFSGSPLDPFEQI